MTTNLTAPPACSHCRQHDSCGECGTRRDEHADQPQQSGFPTLDITDHAFVERPEANPDHYVNADYITDCPSAFEPLFAPLAP